VSAYCLQVISASGNVFKLMRVGCPPLFPELALLEDVGAGGLQVLVLLGWVFDGFAGVGVGVAFVNHAQFGFDVDKQAVIIDVMY
jgi:hypothetical protein